MKNVQTIQELANRKPTGKTKLLTIRFLVSPTELVDDGNGKVGAIKIVKNELYRSEDGSIRARSTDETEEIPVGLVFRSVGYRGVALADVPFNERWGSLYNESGRVTDEAGNVQPGLYCAGWIKRGPSGVIGTNKTDAQETVACMVEDLKADHLLAPESAEVDAARKLIESRQPEFVSYDDWSAIDAAELKKGADSNRPRVKFTNIKDMLAVLSK
jgi:ferredoxin--NADP+ reductase